jgi:hypothetical protein
LADYALNGAAVGTVDSALFRVSAGAAGEGLPANLRFGEMLRSCEMQRENRC